MNSEAGELYDIFVKTMNGSKTVHIENVIPLTTVSQVAAKIQDKEGIQQGTSRVACE
jgi:hypothetical protein